MPPTTTESHHAGTSPAMTKRDSALARFSRQYLCQDLPADGFVGEASVAPPPAVLLHLLGGGGKAIGNFRKIRVGIIQAEDKPTGADPAQRELLKAQIILKHPIVARRLGIMDHHDRSEVADRDRQILRGQPFVQPPPPLLPDLIEPVLDRAKRRI